MSYTKEERHQIAAQILKYAREGKIHSYVPRPTYHLDTHYTESIRPADAVDRAWLEVVARDVMGEIWHDEEYWTSTGKA